MKKAISIKQPWAYLIACGLKDIENRTWKTKYRGKILIHTSSKSDNEPYQLFTDEQWDEIEKNQMDPEVFNSYKDLGMIIGEVDIVDCVINHESIWAEKTHIPHLGDVLDDIKHLGKTKPPKISTIAIGTGFPKTASILSSNNFPKIKAGITAAANFTQNLRFEKSKNFFQYKKTTAKIAPN